MNWVIFPEISPKYKVDCSLYEYFDFTKDNIIMDDWKLNTAPVVRLETPSERFAL